MPFTSMFIVQLFPKVINIMIHIILLIWSFLDPCSQHHGYPLSCLSLPLLASVSKMTLLRFDLHPPSIRLLS
jgi:predicted lipase